MTKKNCKRRAEAWLGVIELRDPALLAIYKPLKIYTIEAGSRNSRSNSSTGFELLTEFMLTDVVERTMGLGVDNGRLQLNLNSNQQ